MNSNSSREDEEMEGVQEDMDWEGKGGQRRVRRKGEMERREKEVSRGAEPGVRGFEEDRLKMDGS